MTKLEELKELEAARNAAYEMWKVVASEAAAAREAFEVAYAAWYKETNQ